MVLLGGETAGVEGEWSPARWLSVGLMPERDGGAFAVERTRPVSFDTDKLDQLDAVFVLSPDRLPPAAWAALGQAVRDGLALWVWPPTGSGGQATARTGWFESMTDALEVEWTLAAEPVDLGEVGVRLDDGREAPPALSLLGADWADLLRPVRVFRRWPIDGYAKDEVWLAATDGEPLLLARGVGRGGVLLSTAAPDTAWTNLPAKPLLVPLLHETIRAVVGGDTLPQRNPRQPLSVGDRMPEGSWRRVDLSEAQAPVGTPTADGTADTADTAHEGDASDDATGGSDATSDSASDAPQAASGPADQPGVFRRIGLYRLLSGPEDDAADTGADARGNEAAGETVAAGRRYLAVNADAPAADTAALTQQAIERWLAPLGPWTFVDPAELAAATEQAGPRVNLAWPLLWALLILVVGETLLSRAFSHASTGGGAVALAGQLWQRLLHPRGESKGQAGA